MYGLRSLSNIDKIKQPLLLSFLQFQDFKNHVLFLKGVEFGVHNGGF